MSRRKCNWFTCCVVCCNNVLSQAGESMGFWAALRCQQLTSEISAC